MQTLDFRTWKPVSSLEQVTPESAPKQPKPQFWLRLWFRLWFRVVATAAAAFFLTSVLLVLVYRWVPVSTTPLMLIRVTENLSQGKPIRFERQWTPISRLSPKLQRSVVAAEDIKFFEHEGFDWQAIEKAIRHNKNGRRIRGGSTISQQVAKNVFLWPKRSWLRKGLEAYFTVLIEMLWGKERIMEVYLNVVELGDGVYGVEAAAERFFRKSAKELSSSEAALVAAVLPNPRRFLIQRPSPYTRFRQTMIQRRMPIAAETFPID
ncbi:MAG: monofunctional biosynthetic peptidoglycan transglycosylase [Bdellovibrionota bacterium]